MVRSPLLFVALVAVAAAVVAPASAGAAGTVTVDKPCYVEGEPIVVTGSAFGPNAQLTLGSSLGGQTLGSAISDPAGAFATRVPAPAPQSTSARAVDSSTLTVVNPLDSTQNASVPFQVANFTVDRGVSRNPKSTRTWYFSGFPTGSTIYGHFRFKGKTAANHRFGTATGACGLLHARARGIPVSRLRTGTWTIQVDTAKTYRRHRIPSLELRVSIFYK
ncbi:MAG: hypothetical protein JWR63_954 [Conexibacter sp.]|nr:hypothetical protein [Conexibacter sp.]